MYSDFPQPGEVGNIYIALDVDQIFVWNTESQSYVQQSWDAYVIQQLQTNIASAQMAFQNLQNSKLDKPNLSINNIPFWHQSGTFFNSNMSYINGNIGIGLPGGATEKLEVGGRTKSDGIVINETTSAILPKEIKFKDGKFKAALADGVEKSVLLEGDVSGGVDFEGFTKLLINENFGWQKVNWGSVTYQNFAIPTNIAQSGHTNEGGGIGSIKGFGITYKSSTTTIAYMRGASHFFIMNGNSISSRRFSIDTTVSTQRIYIGFSDRFRQNNPTNVQLDTLIEFVGICMESGNSNLLLMHNDSSGTATVIDTGFTNATKYVYDLTLTSVYGVNAVTVKLKRIDTTDGSISIFNYTINSNIITNLDAKASFALWCVDSLGTSEVKVTDYGGTCTWRYRTFQP